MTGTGVMVFDTEEHATAAMEVLKPPPDGPTIINCDVFEIALRRREDVCDHLRGGGASAGSSRSVVGRGFVACRAQFGRVV